MMTFYAILAALMMVSVIGFIWPLLCRGQEAKPVVSADSQIYRDQLALIDDDVARGVLAPGQADALRLEIQRRLLSAETGVPKTVHRLNRKRLVAVIALVVPLGSLLLYGFLGNPLVPDMPYRARLADRAGITQTEADRQYAEIQTLTEMLRQTPGDGALWRRVADLNRSLTRFDMAAEAYRNALQHGDTSLDTLVSLGEMLVWSDSKGEISAGAREVFALALTTDPKDHRARYYLGLAQAQDGDVAGALSAWQALRADLPQESPLRAMVGDDIRKARDVLGLGPDPEAMPDWEAVEQMVNGLAAKLKENPDNRDGWVMLGRAYTVMNRPGDALDAFQKALGLTPADSEEYRQIEEMLKAVKSAP